MKPPKAGSRKATVYDVFMAEGLGAAIDKAVSLDLKPGTVKSWAGAWARGGDDVTKEQGAAQSAPRQGPIPFSPIFEHTSHAAAVKQQQAIMRRAGTAEGAYHILEQDGRFAVVPAHHKSKGAFPQFEEGDWVMDTIIPNSLGRIKKAGKEQCEVVYAKPRGGFGALETIIPNVYLYKVEPPSSKKSRARIKTEPAKKEPVKSKGKKK